MANENSNVRPLYHIAETIYDLVNSEGCPEEIRAIILTEIMRQVQNITAQLDWSDHLVLTELWPLVLDLERTALYQPPETSLAAEVQAIRKAA